MLLMKKNSQYLVASCYKLLQQSRSLRSFFPRGGAIVVHRQLEGVATGYGAVATGRLQHKITEGPNTTASSANKTVNGPKHLFESRQQQKSKGDITYSTLPILTIWRRAAK